MLPGERTNITRLRYVLYARKSTEDENRQVRSIDDQIKDCQKLAADLGLQVIGEPVKEMRSAKRPGRRPLFNQMIKDIEAKKYDAILCWHPDRLCRNMLEGGQIINMLDEDVLKDVRFNSHQFSNDANGKMLLGMLFVFSKQYSDDLSAKVGRGVRGNLSEGKSSGTPKWGYERSVNGLYEPNESFGIVRDVWLRRSEGASLDECVNFLLKQGYARHTKDPKQPRLIKPSKNALSVMFRDPFYYGVLVQADQTVDLREIYDFETMVSEDQYNLVQALGYGRTKDVDQKKRVTFYPLRQFVYCAVCNSQKYMLAGKNRSGSGRHVLTYRCDNPVCTRKPKSLRAKNIFNSIYVMLEGLQMAEDAYEQYSRRLDDLTDMKVVEIKQQAQSRHGVLSHVKSELDRLALGIDRHKPDSPIYKAQNSQIEALAVRQADLEYEILELEKKVSDPKRIKLSKEEFLNVIKTASDKMKAGSAVEKDRLCRILFLNVQVDNEKVAHYLWREPFASLIRATEVSSGQAGDTNFEQYLEAVAEWLTFNPTPAWRKELANAGRLTQQQTYSF